MKVVIFCGGLGTRMREYSQVLPKPLADIRQRPVLWYVMRYYAHYGYKDFILCTGYKASLIKAYFDHHALVGNGPFVLPDPAGDITLYGEQIADWNVRCVDTGLHSSIGDRLRAIEPLIGDDERFMANYSDGVTDLHLPTLVDYAIKRDRIGTILAVRPNHSFHAVMLSAGDTVTSITDVKDSGVLINGGYFVLKRDIFKYVRPNEELVSEPFARLIEQEQLVAYRHQGYWACMDTFKDKTQLEKMIETGQATWQVWQNMPAQLVKVPVHRA